MTEEVDVVVIGAGVVGLAIARALALKSRDVIVLEQHELIGSETSSRNSEVIHAGIYYRPGGLRARLCVPGKWALYKYCEERGVPHKRCEKLIVASNAKEAAALGALKKVAAQNGVDDLVETTAAQASKLEPGLCCEAALLSPSSGIVDSHTLMLTLLGDVEDNRGALALSSPLISGEVVAGGIELNIGGAEPVRLKARLVINSAGLHTETVARSIAGLDAGKIPHIRPAKGQYFSYSGKAPFSRLIYPLHAPDSQGVHYTRDLGGQARLGPDIRWDAPFGDYSVDETRLDAFVEEVSRFWPSIDKSRLNPGYAGVRPKATGPGEEGDFLIHAPEHHGTEGYIALYAIESPGLTACLAIGDYVAKMATEQG